MSATQQKFCGHLGPELFIIVSLKRNFDSVSCNSEDSTFLFILMVQKKICGMHVIPELVNYLYSLCR